MAIICVTEHLQLQRAMITDEDPVHLGVEPSLQTCVTDPTIDLAHFSAICSLELFEVVLPKEALGALPAWKMPLQLERRRGRANSRHCLLRSSRPVQRSDAQLC